LGSFLAGIGLGVVLFHLENSLVSKIHETSRVLCICLWHALCHFFIYFFWAFKKNIDRCKFAVKNLPRLSNISGSATASNGPVAAFRGISARSEDLLLMIPAQFRFSIILLIIPSPKW
jgi:hypothetical protein